MAFAVWYIRRFRRRPKRHRVVPIGFSLHARRRPTYNRQSNARASAERSPAKYHQRWGIRLERYQVSEHRWASHIRNRQRLSPSCRRRHDGCKKEQQRAIERREPAAAELYTAAGTHALLRLMQYNYRHVLLDGRRPCHGLGRDGHSTSKAGGKASSLSSLLALPTLSTSSSRLGRLLLEQCRHVVRAAGDVRYLSPRQRHHLLRLIPRLRLSAGAAPEAVRAARPDCIQRPRVFVFFRAKGERAEKEAREKEERRRINITWEAFAFRSKRRRGGGIGEGEHAKLCPHGLSGSFSVLKIVLPLN